MILFENNGDTALQDIYINDVIPTNFEIKDWYIKGANGKRDDCEITTEEVDSGTQASWMVPMVGKGERLEVCFEIKGNGEVDGYYYYVRVSGETWKAYSNKKYNKGDKAKVKKSIDNPMQLVL